MGDLVILRDQFGEVEAGIGDLFEFNGATLSVVCLDSEASTPGRPILTVRLYKGPLEYQGNRWEIEEGKNPPLFYFTAELVATCLRASRKGSSQAPPVEHPPEFEALKSEALEKPEKTTGSGKKSKARPQEDQPTLW